MSCQSTLHLHSYEYKIRDQDVVQEVETPKAEDAVHHKNHMARWRGQRHIEGDSLVNVQYDIGGAIIIITANDVGLPINLT